jgi:hypothetical protein
VLIAGAILALAIRTYARLPVNGTRRSVLVMLRAFTLMALALFLMRPVVVRRLPPSSNIVPVIVDASRSMAIAESGSSRFERSVALATGALAAALPGYRLELLELRDDIGLLDKTRAPSGDSSDLAAALAAVRDRYRGRPVPGIVLLSDGVDTGDIDVGEAASDLPVFPVAVGDSAPPRDQEVLSLDLDPDALPGSSVQLRATVVAHGYGRDPIDVRLLAFDRTIEMRRVSPAADGLPVRVAFDLPPAGQEPAVYAVEVPPREGEAVLDNNARRALVQPIGRRRRLLFLQGAPGYEHGFLARAWATDAYLDTDIVVRKGQNDQGAATFYVQAAGDRAAAIASGIPADRAALFAYDAIVLGNATHDLMTAAQLNALDAFVSQRGGGLLLLGGRSFGPGGLGAGPLGAMVPVSPGHASVDAARAAWRAGEPNKLTLTSAGGRHAMLRLAASTADSERRWDSAPALGGFAPVGPLRPGAQLLAVTTSAGVARPLIAVQRYGAGRSMVFAGEASWRWKMQRPAEDHLYETFWRQAARWLSAPAPDPLAIDVDADARPGTSSTVGVTVRDAGFEPIGDAAVDLSVRDERGREEVIRATTVDAGRGRYTARWQPARRGLYRMTARVTRAAARPGTPRNMSAVRDVFAGGADLETADPRIHQDVLARIAERSGGRLVSEEDLAPLAQALRARSADSSAVAVQELWHGPWTFVALIALLAGEWTLRRRWGLR